MAYVLNYGSNNEHSKEHTGTGLTAKKRRQLIKNHFNKLHSRSHSRSRSPRKPSNTRKYSENRSRSRSPKKPQTIVTRNNPNFLENMHRKQMSNLLREERLSKKFPSLLYTTRHTDPRSGLSRKNKMKLYQQKGVIPPF